MGVNFKLHATVSKTGKSEEKKIEDTKCIPKRFNVWYVLNDGREKIVFLLLFTKCMLEIDSGCFTLFAKFVQEKKEPEKKIYHLDHIKIDHTYFSNTHFFFHWK